MRIMIALFLLTVWVGLANCDETKKESVKQAEKPVSFWMEKKMEYSQTILRGLATGELEQVAVTAEQMRLLSKVEGFIRSKKPGYRAQLHVFELANREIERQAKANNLEGAAMAFHQLTTSCVSCHRLLRSDTGVQAPEAEAK
jgi:hypothetical protein